MNCKHIQSFKNLRSRAFMNAISAFGLVRRQSFCFLPYEDTVTRRQPAYCNKVLDRATPCWHANCRLSVSKAMKNTFWLFIAYPMYSILIYWPKLRQFISHSFPLRFLKRTSGMSPTLWFLQF